MRRGPISALRSEQRGIGAMEFALLAPVLAVFLVGIVDLARGYSAKLTLEEAAYRALEKVSAGAMQSDYAFVKSEAVVAAGVPDGNVTVDNWLECDGSRQSAFDGACPVSQQTARYVQVTIRGTFRPSFPYGRQLFNADADGAIPIQVVEAVRVQ